MRVGFFVGIGVGTDGLSDAPLGAHDAVRVSAVSYAGEAREDGLAPVYLAIRHAGKRALLPLAPYGVPNLRPSKWNEARGEARRTQAHAAAVNLRIAEAIGTAERLSIALGSPSARALRDATREALDAEHGRCVESEPEPEACFLDFCREQVAGYEARGQVGTHDQYRTVVDKITAYAGVPRLPYRDVTPALVRGFYAWLLAPQPAGRGNAPNTARKSITTLRTFWGRARREGLVPLDLPSAEPWHAVTPTSVRARKRKLSPSELETLLTSPLPEGPMRLWRDVFAFAFYCGGARFGDVCWMTRGDLRGSDAPADTGGGWRAAWRQENTSDLHAIALAPAALAVLDRLRPDWRRLPPDALLLPALDYEVARGGDIRTARGRDKAKRRANARANKHLRRAVLRLGLVGDDGEPVPVSTHLARHSLAGYLLEQGASPREIQRILGHSSVQVTEGYLRGFDTAVADDLTRHISIG